jgi:hypothetical protein
MESATLYVLYYTNDSRVTNYSAFEMCQVRLNFLFCLVQF